MSRVRALWANHERGRESQREPESEPERARANQKEPELWRSLERAREGQRKSEDARQSPGESQRVSLALSDWISLSLSGSLISGIFALWADSAFHHTLVLELKSLCSICSLLCSERNEYWISITWMMIAGMKSDWYANFPLPPAPTPSQWPHFHWLQSCKMSFVSHRANIEIFFTPFRDARYICEIFVTFCNFNWA